jgi:hypothetical protein
MTHHEPISTTESKPSANGRLALDQPRLRATLRLCFAPEQADALAGRVDRDAATERETLARLIRPARLNYSSERVLSLTRHLRRTRDAERPLAPRLGLASMPALALALHLGLGLDIETLAALFRRSEHEMSLALCEARRAAEPERVTPCAEFVSAIGRYRNPAAGSIDERLAFMQHVATCSRCRPALEAARVLDERLISAIEGYERSLSTETPAVTSRRALWLEPALLCGGSLLLVALLLASVVGVRRWVMVGTAPVTLLSAEAVVPQFSGWLLQTSDSGDISAVNLASGEQRLLARNVAGRIAQFKMAPDRQQIARLSYRINADAPATLIVYGLDGTVKNEWDRLPPTETNLTLDWLDRATVIVSSIPAPLPSETADAFNARAQETGRLLAFDVNTGVQRALLDGWINGTFVSPDGRHLAITRHMGTGESIVEVHPVTAGGLGPPVTTSRSLSPILVTLLGWSADNRLIIREQTSTGTAIDSLSLDGASTQLTQLASNIFQNMITLSPDGTYVIYATTSNPGAGPWDYWRLSLDDGTPQKLAEGEQAVSSSGLLQGVWSPDGETLALTLGEDFYLPNPAQDGSATSIASYRVVALDANGQPRGSVLDQFTNQALLTWLPDDTLPPRTDSGNSTPFRTSNLNTVGSAGLRPQLSDDSSLSPDGTKALIYDESYDFSMAYPLGNDTPAQIGGPPSDPNWLPDGSGGIGVQHHAGDSGQISRIAVFGNIGFAGNSVTDYDPAELGDSTTAAYRYPLLAPDGLHYSFFVRDRQVVTLWVGGYQGAPHTVAGWQIPGGAKIDPPLIVRWVNNTTLIFAEPGDWRNGLPQQVTLQRVTLANGNATDDTLIGWRTHGTERGIVLRELRLPADQSQVAVRLRHITGRDPNRGAFDSLAALDTRDLHQSVELARGTPGDGLSWSPDSRQLVTVIQSKLTVFTIRGGGIEQVDTGDFAPSYPLWVLPNEIWYESSSGNTQQVARATR